MFFRCQSVIMIETFINKFDGRNMKMLALIRELLQQWKIDCFAPLPLSACTVKKPYLLEREGIRDGSVIIIAVPYRTPLCDVPERNLSAYAVCKNYHAFFDALYADVLPRLSAAYPEHRFAGFADHSPIAEVEAAAKAGLGVIGKNHLLLTEKYSSYIFLGELVTDAALPCELFPVRECENCGACMRACPASKLGTCLSALTQKKGELNDAEKSAMLAYGSVWGCDICQDSCPHTLRAKATQSIYTPIPYFYEDPVPVLTLDVLDQMSDEHFLTRAFSWRGKEVVRRNLALFEKGDREC